MNTLTPTEYAEAVAGFSAALRQCTQSLSSIDLHAQPAGSAVASLPPIVLDQQILIGLRKFIWRIDELHAAAAAIGILGGELTPEDRDCLIKLDEVFDKVLGMMMGVLTVSPTRH